MPNGLGGCYSWEAVFSPQVKCPTSDDSSTSCPDATWFWVLAGAVGLIAILKKRK